MSMIEAPSIYDGLNAALGAGALYLGYRQFKFASTRQPPYVKAVAQEDPESARWHVLDLTIRNRADVSINLVSVSVPRLRCSRIVGEDTVKQAQKPWEDQKREYPKLRYCVSLTDRRLITKHDIEAGDQLSMRFFMFRMSTSIHLRFCSNDTLSDFRMNIPIHVAS
ncbi:MAG: hypothetical protein RSE12_17150 [Fuscovulum sp.]|nr:MAG: hypothetical protein RSE12_17150 [Fuscovulum sp.]